MMSAEQEREVVRQVLDGNTAKFADIVREYQDSVAHLCFRLAGGRLDVEEIVQQVFVELYSALARFRFESKLGTFIYRITVNVVSKNMKHEQRRVSIDANGDFLTTEIDGGAEEKIFKDEQNIQLRKAIGQLKAEQRTALVLFAFEDFSYNEIADVMQISLSKVESLIFRAKKNLRKMLMK